MKKMCLTIIMLSLICTFIAGCLAWDTSVNYELLFSTSEINSIRIYETDYESEVLYNYSDPVDPCGELLCEIPPERYVDFTEELTDLSFVEHHLIMLLPIAVDPNFYYGYYIVKIEYRDGSCELISDSIQRQFRANEKYPDSIDYTIEQDAWLTFLQNWADIPDSASKE